MTSKKRFQWWQFCKSSCVTSFAYLHIKKAQVRQSSNFLSRIQTQRAHSTNLRAVRTKAASSTEGSPPSDDCHGPPIAMKLRSFLRIANLRILQKWGMRSSELLSDDNSSRAFLLIPLIKII